MALVKPGAMVSEASGKVGGTVFARNKYGRYARNWQKPVNPNTDLQQDRKANTAYLSQLWKSLTSDTRAAWNSYAALTPTLNRLGESILLSGFNQFMKSNSVKILAGPTGIPVEPPVTPGYSAIPNASAFTLQQQATDPGPLELVIADPIGIDIDDEALLLVSVSPPISAGISFYKGPWILASANDTLDVGTTPVPLDSAGNYNSGASIFLMLRQIDHFNKVSSQGIYGPFIVQVAP